jgi:hypothetical protein
MLIKMENSETAGYMAKDPIVITRCLKIPCSRFYTDSISQRLLVMCKDPRHNEYKDEGKIEGQDKEKSKTLARTWEPQANAESTSSPDGTAENAI